jgi:L-alanine-DL-glutamate epimerase-like enolase superfamily enzyme
MRRLSVGVETWPISGHFTIARGTKTAVEVIVVTLEEDGVTGRGEAVPYARYGETPAASVAALERARARIETGLERDAIGVAIAPLSARNALDCALWDLEAKRRGRPVWELAGLAQPLPLETAFTISLDAPEAMARAAAAAQGRNLLKLKLGQDDDDDRLRAVRASVPEKRLIVDANEGWSPANLEARLAACAGAGVELVEQPLPAGGDGLLAQIDRPVPVCADESLLGPESLAGLAGRYDAVNIKLDKTGGLTVALALATAAEQAGFRLMVGCMLATSLAMAPAFLLAQRASYVDLDGPLLLQRDRPDAIRYEGATMFPPSPALWG